MRLRHIEIFYAVYATGSISNAARMLNVSQPTVSQILKHAEDQLGYNLFHRVKGRLIPTDEAMALFEETREIYKMVGSLRKKASNLHQNVDGRIRIGSVPAIGLQALPMAIADYSGQRSSVEFDVQVFNQVELMNALRTQEKDIGLALDPPAAPGFVRVPICDVEIVCIYSRGEFDEYPARLELGDLHDHVAISVEESGPIGDRIHAALEAANVTLNARLTSQNLYLARNMVGQGCGIAVVDELTARASGMGKISFKGFKEPIKVSLMAVHLENRQPSKACERFLNFAAQKYFTTSFLASNTAGNASGSPKRIFK